MKLVILAGGYGTRISEETKIKPKPLIKIGDKPIIWHLMKIYSTFGINDFIICLGYKGYMIKEELGKYMRHENWKIRFVNTGLHTMTGGRVKRIQKYINKDKHFCLSYGDGLSNVNIKKLFKYLKDDKSIFEQDCLPVLSKSKQLMAFKHNGFWACMDTLREKKELNTFWKQKKCAWKIW